MNGLPLSALLSQALVAFTIEWDNEAEHRSPHRTTGAGRAPGAPAGAPWLTSLVMWANCLRFVPDEGITVAGLRELARTQTNLDGMRRWGTSRTSRTRAGGSGRPGTRSCCSPRAAARRGSGLEPYPDGWRARNGRPALLPHYPMVLHRGGYPDGS